MRIERVEEEILQKFSGPVYGNTIFTTYEWVQFLKKNQHAELVVLELHVRAVSRGCRALSLPRSKQPVPCRGAL